MRRVAYTVTWRNGVAMAIRDIPATGIVDTGIVATMDILMEVITGEGTIIPITTTTGLITGVIMAIHMDTGLMDTGLMDSGSASVIKNRKRIRAEARGSGGVRNMSPLLPDFVRM